MEDTCQCLSYNEQATKGGLPKTNILHVLPECAPFCHGRDYNI
jgi:hypothetical protein